MCSASGPSLAARTFVAKSMPVKCMPVKYMPTKISFFIKMLLVSVEFSIDIKALRRQLLKNFASGGSRAQESIEVSACLAHQAAHARHRTHTFTKDPMLIA